MRNDDDGSYESFTVIEGKTTHTISFELIEGADQAKIRCIVTNSDGGQTISNEAEITVTAAG